MKYPARAGVALPSVAGVGDRSPIPGSVSRMSPTAVAAGELDDAVPLAAEVTGPAWEGASPPLTSKTTSTACTGTTPPTAPRVSSTLPDRGEVMVTVALSVITSTIGWSSATVSPGAIIHLTISPSVTPSPMSGSLNS